MDKDSQKSTMPLYRWIWKSYLKTALIPLILVEMVFIGIYFTANSWSQREMVNYLRDQVQTEMLEIVNKESDVIHQQLSSISNATEIYQRQMGEALAADAILSAEDTSRLKYSPDGVYYTASDSKEGGAAIFYSGYVPIGEKERAKTAKALTMQKLMKNILQSQPLAASIYLNTFDSLNIIYPYFDVLPQYAPKMNIPTYNFYYEADLKHNPERTVKWTDVYLDPAGNGWMASAIAPVYDGNFLEGVVGIDVTVSTIVKQILKLEIPYEGYGILVSKDGNIMALPEKGEADWGLDELTDHHYDEAIMQDTFKPDQFNLYKRDDIKTFYKDVAANKMGFSTIRVNGNPKVVSWATISETGWKLLIIVPEKNIYEKVDRLSHKMFQIGTLMIAGLFLFYCIFFFILSRKAKRMSLNISRPLTEINGIVEKIGEGHYYQQEPDMNVKELKDTTANLIKMGRQLGEANSDLMDAQEKLRKRESDLNALVNSIDDVIVTVDENGRFLNAWAKERDNLSNSYLNSSANTIGDIFDIETASLYQTKIKQIIDTGISDCVEYSVQTNKGYKWFQARISLVDDKERTAVVSARDITQRIEMEKSIILAKEEAEKANKAKSQFLSNMSHELRTPLNAVLGFAQVLQMDTGTPLDELQSQSVKEILKAGNHLLTLINEVLDLAKIESGKLSLSIEPVQIVPMIEETLTIIKPMAEQYGIHINQFFEECNKDYILADRTRIKQVLINLLSNAIKYNKENGQVTFYCEKNMGSIRINVLDTGIGIEESELNNIFQPFHRISNLDRVIEGTGIGLTVAKQLIELMNGSIGVNSQVGSGSHFWIDLPCSEIITEISGDPVKQLENINFDENDNIYKIIYVEDNPANLKLVERIIGHIPNTKMISATTGELCVDMAKAHKPNLILLDINLPGIDGFEVLRRLRENAETVDIPVMAVSANAMPRDIEKGKACGFIDYITKPIDVRNLLDKIKQILTKGN